MAAVSQQTSYDAGATVVPNSLYRAFLIRDVYNANTGVATVPRDGQYKVTVYVDASSSPNPLKVVVTGDTKLPPITCPGRGGPKAHRFQKFCSTAWAELQEGQTVRLVNEVDGTSYSGSFFILHMKLDPSEWQRPYYRYRRPRQL